MMHHFIVVTAFQRLVCKLACRDFVCPLFLDASCVFGDVYALFTGFVLSVANEPSELARRPRYTIRMIEHFSCGSCDIRLTACVYRHSCGNFDFFVLTRRDVRCIGVTVRTVRAIAVIQRQTFIVRHIFAVDVAVLVFE